MELMSAAEALQKSKEKELENISALIYGAITAGKREVAVRRNISDDTMKELKRLGYSVDSSNREEMHIIKWG